MLGISLQMRAKAFEERIGLLALASAWIRVAAWLTAPFFTAGAIGAFLTSALPQLGKSRRAASVWTLIAVAGAEPGVEVVSLVADEREADHEASLLEELGTALGDLDLEVAAMLERGDAGAGFGRRRKIDIGKDRRRVPRRLGQHLAPGRDDQAVAEGGTAVLMQAALRGGEHEGAGLDGAGADQNMPMRFAGLLGEGGGDGDELGAGERRARGRAAGSGGRSRSKGQAGRREDRQRTALPPGRQWSDSR